MIRHEAIDENLTLMVVGGAPQGLAQYSHNALADKQLPLSNDARCESRGNLAPICLHRKSMLVAPHGPPSASFHSFPLGSCSPWLKPGTTLLRRSASSGEGPLRRTLRMVTKRDDSERCPSLDAASRARRSPSADRWVWSSCGRPCTAQHRPKPAATCFRDPG